MVKLSSPIQKQVERKMDESNMEFDKGNYVESIKFLEEAWVLLPNNPKGIYDESFHIVLYITETYLLIKDTDQANKWVDRIFQCDLERIDCGEREFLAGKVAYESGDFEKAKKYFIIANEKSEGRCFTSNEGEYLRFFKKKCV